MSLPRLSAQQPIVTTGGKPSSPFLQFMEEARKSQEATDTGQSELLEQQAANLALINQALQLAGLALETADGATGGSVRSGSNSGTETLQSSFLPITQVDLLTVSAGNLTFPGTAPYADILSSITGGSFLSGEYQIIEVDNGIDNGVVFNGTFTVQNTGTMMLQNLLVSDTSSPSVGTVTLSRTTTGSISYRAEIRNLTPGVSVTDMGFYLFARRT